MKFISWNVNGLRACMNKGFQDTFYQLNADFFCLQETKLQAGQIRLDLPGYEQYWCYAEKKGYSGTAIFTKHTPLSVSYGLGVEELDTEGRLITLEYPEFYLVTCYTPNAQRGLARIDHRLKWEDAFRAYLKELDSKKPVILCGDLNVAHKEIDLKNPGSNRGNAGFSDEERNAFTQLLESGFTDSFRHLYPDKTGAYSWWSYMFNARANNAGWRIDYFVVSDRLSGSIHDATIHPEYLGSDHCPVGLDLNTTCNGGIWSPETERPHTDSKTEADGDSPAGHILKLGITVAVLATLLLIIPKITSPQIDPTSPETRSTEPQSNTDKLIQWVKDLSGKASLTYRNADPISSSTTPYITYDDIQRKLTDTSIIHTAQPPETDDNENHIILYPMEYNFFVQVEFPPYESLFSDSYPDIGVEISLPNSVTMLKAYYVDPSGVTRSCFLYGYATDPFDLKVKVSHNGLYQIQEAVSIVPTGVFDDLTTSELITKIQQSGIIVNAYVSSYSDSLSDLVETDPYIQELLKRDDAIKLLLDELERNHGHYTLIGTANLLTTKQFQSRMTDAEQERMAEIIANRSDEVFYG